MERFTTRAEIYDAGRPTYPPAAIEALLAGLGDPATLVVADLGAGTGISTRALAERGARVLALEPNAAMRAKAQPHPLVRWIDGTAEATTLADGEVDVAAAFQAWHWFDHDAALRELGRIVRRRGRIGVLYYERDERDPFTVAFGEIFRRYATEPIEGLRAAALARFAALPGAVRCDFGNAQQVDREGLGARLRSSSYLPHDGVAAEHMHAEADALFARFSSDGAVSIALITTLVVAPPPT